MSPRSQGLTIDTARLSRRLGVPVVSAVGNKGLGLDEIIEAVAGVAAHGRHLPGPADICRDQGPAPGALAAPEKLGRAPRVDYGEDAERTMAQIVDAVGDAELGRWQQVKLLEQDPKVLETLAVPGAREAVVGLAAGFAARLEEDVDVFLARCRYGFVGEVIKTACRAPTARMTSVSDRIDRVAMHPVWGVPIFLTLMYVVFTLTFSLGNPLMDLIDQGFGWLGGAISGFWPAGSSSPLKSLLVDGIIGGVGGVIVFLPNIVLLFLAIAILEGTGYMARAAFVMDRFMTKVGLHGKSFIPLLIGFGCTVPAIMATRTLETRRDRLITMMVLPLMSCGARLPIYALMIPAFFPAQLAGAGPVADLRDGHRAGPAGGAAAAGHHLPRRDHALRDGAAAVPAAHGHEPAGADVDPRLAVPAEGGHGDPGRGGDPLVLDLLPQAAGRLRAAPGLRPGAGGAVSGAPAVAYGQITDPDEAQAAELSYSIAGRVGRLIEPVLKPHGLRLAHRHRPGGRHRRQGGVRGPDGHRLRRGRGRRDQRAPAQQAARTLQPAGGVLHHAVRPDLDAVHRHLRHHAAGGGLGQAGPWPRSGG